MIPWPGSAWGMPLVRRRRAELKQQQREERGRGVSTRDSAGSLVTEMWAVGQRELMSLQGPWPLARMCVASQVKPNAVGSRASASCNLFMNSFILHEGV